MGATFRNGIDALNAGNKEEARRIFRAYVSRHPENENGWIWMYHAARNDSERIQCLEKILQIAPANQRAGKLLKKLKQPHSISLPSSTGIQFLGVAGILVLFSIFLVSSVLAAPLVFQGSTSAEVSEPQSNPPFVENPPLVIPTNTATLALSAPGIGFSPATSTPIPTIASEIAASPKVTVQPTATLETVTEAKIDPVDWRDWPIVPSLSPRAKQILAGAQSNQAINLHTFSKVGDCQMTSGTFLAGYVKGTYKVPEGSAETIEWFADSMTAENITAVNGYGINTVLDPAYALKRGNEQCLAGETPLDCELRTRKPAVVLIGMGTNWIPHAEESFEKHLRNVVDTVLKTGALPILATKADNVEGDWKLNQAIAQVAYDYDLPLVNVWLSVQDLPGRGIERRIYLTGDGWMSRNAAWLATLETVHAHLAK